MEDEVQVCRWCDAVGHDGGDFGDYCPGIQPRGWFDPAGLEDETW